MFERINNDIVSAMKAKDKDTLDVIRMVKGAMQLESISKKRNLEDDEVIAIVSKQIKMRKESIEEFKKANRTDLIEKTESEIVILNKYLPEQLSDEELSKIIDEIIVKVEAKNDKDMGKIMKELAPLVKGKADMGKVNMMIKEKLSIN
jgi:uncharacterized protein YqeY